MTCSFYQFIPFYRFSFPQLKTKGYQESDETTGPCIQGTNQNAALCHETTPHHTTRHHKTIGTIYHPHNVTPTQYNTRIRYDTTPDHQTRHHQSYRFRRKLFPLLPLKNSSRQRQYSHPPILWLLLNDPPMIEDSTHFPSCSACISMISLTTSLLVVHTIIIVNACFHPAVCWTIVALIVFSVYRSLDRILLYCLSFLNECF